MSESHEILTSELNRLRRNAGQSEVTKIMNESLKSNLQQVVQELETQKASVQSIDNERDKLKKELNRIKENALKEQSKCQHLIKERMLNENEIESLQKRIQMIEEEKEQVKQKFESQIAHFTSKEAQQKKLEEELLRVSMEQSKCQQQERERIMTKNKMEEKIKVLETEMDKLKEKAKIAEKEKEDIMIEMGKLEKRAKMLSEEGKGNGTGKFLETKRSIATPGEEDNSQTEKMTATVDEQEYEKCRIYSSGEQYELVGENLGTSSWWLARNKTGKVGYIPANYVQKCGSDSLEQYDWFYSKTSRTQSEEILQSDGREGVFLVRESSQKDMFALSVFTKCAGIGMVNHYQIKINSENKYFLVDKHTFATIPELIYYHKHNCAGLIVRLRFPPGDRSCLKPTCGLGHNLKEIDIDMLEIKEEFGSFDFSKMHRAIYMGRVEVAVMTMNEGAMHNEDFIEAAKTMMKLQHDNLIKLYGVCAKQQPILMVTEFLSNGALLTYLHRYRQRLLANHDTLIDMCLQVCSGMRYLEEESVIHRDLAARNCLVGDKGIVKVGEFCLARYVLDDEYTSSAGAKFPIKWTSPEVLHFSKFSSKSDIWAYGILLWEIFSGGEMPYGEMKNTDVVDKVCNEKYRLPIPDGCPDAIYRIMLSCWDQSPERRPSFLHLYEELCEIRGPREYED